jgi:hypothetical protein
MSSEQDQLVHEYAHRRAALHNAIVDYGPEEHWLMKRC